MGVVRRRVRRRLEPLIREQVDRSWSENGDLASLRDRVEWLENEMARMGPHVAAQGERIGVLEQGYRPVVGDEGQVLAAEHARIRARTALISQYEERLNRLESALARAPVADDS